MITVEQTLEVLQYVRLFTGKLFVIKIGGSCLENPGVFREVCRDIGNLRAAGIRLVLVHGGGAAINEALQKQNIPWEFKDGIRITTPEMMDVIEMVLTGKINKYLTRILNAMNIPAVGMSGTDQSFISCQYTSAEYGEVGSIEKIDNQIIEHHLSSQADPFNGTIPVISPIGFHPSGKALNINADWAASVIASSLAAEKLIYLTNTDGILKNDGSLVKECDASQLETLIAEGHIKEGMLAKANTIIDALKQGMPNIHVINGNKPNSLIQELFTTDGTGTLCTKRVREKVKL